MCGASGFPSSKNKQLGVSSEQKINWFVIYLHVFAAVKWNPSPICIHFCCKQTPLTGISDPRVWKEFSEFMYVVLNNIKG